MNLHSGTRLCVYIVVHAVTCVEYMPLRASSTGRCVRRVQAAACVQYRPLRTSSTGFCVRRGTGRCVRRVQAVALVCVEYRPLCASRYRPFVCVEVQAFVCVEYMPLCASRGTDIYMQGWVKS